MNLQALNLIKKLLVKWGQQILANLQCLDLGMSFHLGHFRNRSSKFQLFQSD
jgi:hypothetical protein